MEDGLLFVLSTVLFEASYFLLRALSFGARFHLFLHLDLVSRFRFDFSSATATATVPVPLLFPHFQISTQDPDKMRLIIQSLLALAAVLPTHAFTNGTLIPSYFCNPVADGMPKSLGQLIPFLQKEQDEIAFNPNGMSSLVQCDALM